MKSLPYSEIKPTDQIIQGKSVKFSPYFFFLLLLSVIHVFTQMSAKNILIVLSGEQTG